MEVIVLVTINAEALYKFTTEADIADMTIIPIAKEIGYLLGKRSPYHAAPIAEHSIENDGEQMVFTMNTEYFDYAVNFDEKEDFEIFFNAANCSYRVSWANIVSETSAAYDMADDLRDAINQRVLLNEYLHGYETEWDIDMDNPEPDGDKLVYNCRVTIS